MRSRGAGVQTLDVPSWPSFSLIGFRFSIPEIGSVPNRKNVPINNSKRNEIEGWTNWVLRVSGAHPSFGRDQTELRDFTFSSRTAWQKPKSANFIISTVPYSITLGLNQLQSLGIVHGNLKPSNILVLEAMSWPSRCQASRMLRGSNICRLMMSQNCFLHDVRLNQLNCIFAHVLSSRYFVSFRVFINALLQFGWFNTPSSG